MSSPPAHTRRRLRTRRRPPPHIDGRTSARPRRARSFAMLDDFASCLGLGPQIVAVQPMLPRIERRLADFREEESPEAFQNSIKRRFAWPFAPCRLSSHARSHAASNEPNCPRRPKWDSLRPCWPVGMICMLAGACTFLRKRASPRRHERPSVSGKVHESQAIIAKAASNGSCSFVTKAIMIRASSRT